jgi:putative tryptophan/tyrosine transport system substrate-binding protein
MMKRRDFITLLGGAAAWPLAARAQQPAMPVIGFLGPGSAQSDSYRVTAFRQGLSEAGLVEGRNFTIEYRWADSHYDRLPAFATELVQRQVAVIAASSTPATLAAKAATTTIPIVFETAANPVKLGLVASFNRPGGNITGVINGVEEIARKRLELLHELLPKAGSLALLVNPTAAELAELQTREVRSAAQTLGVHLHILNASTEQDFDRVFARLTELRAGGLVIGGDAFFTRHVKQLAALTVQHAVPAIYLYREFAAAGGLMSYGTNITDTHRLVGIYAGRILKGDKPADLPVQQATTKVEMYINLKTARPAPPGCMRGRSRRKPNKRLAFQPNSAARSAQFSRDVKKLLQSPKNWRHRWLVGGSGNCRGRRPQPPIYRVNRPFLPSGQSVLLPSITTAHHLTFRRSLGGRPPGGLRARAGRSAHYRALQPRKRRPGCTAHPRSAAGPGCVKTHFSVKCEKYNSPVRIKPLCAQHGLTLMMRNSSEIFYARGGHLGFHTAWGPITDIGRLHSNSSSARTSRDSGTSIPSALAACRLTKSSTLLGPSTGRSAGFAPLRMRST